MAGNKTLTMLRVEHLSKSNQKNTLCPHQARNEKVAICFFRYFFSLGSKLIQTFHPGSIKNSANGNISRTTTPETERAVMKSCFPMEWNFKNQLLSFILLFAQLLLFSHDISINWMDPGISDVCHKAVKAEQYISIFNTGDAKHAPTTTIA